jgi:hypothetical protein
MAPLKKWQYDPNIAAASSYYDLSLEQQTKLYRWMQSDPGIEMGFVIGGGAKENLLRGYKANAKDSGQVLINTGEIKLLR